MTFLKIPVYVLPNVHSGAEEGPRLSGAVGAMITEQIKLLVEPRAEQAAPC
jgi:hypothetical protein